MRTIRRSDVVAAIRCWRLLGRMVRGSLTIKLVVVSIQDKHVIVG